MKAAEKIKKEQAKAKRERWENQLERDMRAAKITGFTKQFKFHESRGWLFDFAFLHHRLAIEVDGLVWEGKGGHQTGVGYQNDRYKDQAALLDCWRVYRCTPEMIKNGQALQTIEMLLKHGFY